MAVYMFPHEKGIGDVLGEALGQVGTGIGQGLSSGFEKIANLKMQNYANRQYAALQNELKAKQRAQQAQGLAVLFGPEQGQLISQLDPSIQALFVKSKLAEPGNQSFLQTFQALSGITSQGQGIGGNRST